VVLDEAAASKLINAKHYKHVEHIKRQYGV
jgi:hypothetical protein